MTNMEARRGLTKPIVVYNQQHHRELAMCALGAAIAKDLQLMIVGTPCAKDDKSQRYQGATKERPPTSGAP